MSTFDRLTEKVAEYERRGAGLSDEVFNHYLNEAVAAPPGDAFEDLALRAAMAMVPRPEWTEDMLSAVAAAWMMGAAAGAGAALGQGLAVT